MAYSFPDQFQWGVATSAYQIEGATNEEGRSPSVWDQFRPSWQRLIDRPLGTYRETRLRGAEGCDHYHRYRDDIQLIKALGTRHYRFSTSWCRIVPDGRGQVNPQGLDFYDRLVDHLLENHIEPLVTLFHWDSPQALETRYGSWQSREMAQDFADYASVVVAHLGDRVTRWVTLNELTCFTHLSYDAHKIPEHAPGTRVKTQREVWQTSHHGLLAHGLGVQAIRAASPQPCHIGIVDNPGITVPIAETPEHITAAQNAFPYQGGNGGMIYPMLTGAYHPGFLEQLGEDAPDIQPGDLKTIHQPIDFLGLNIYTGTHIRAADNAKGCDWIPTPSHYPRMHMPWLQIVPESLYWGIRHVSETLDRPDLPIYITENGCAANDRMNEVGEILDTDRILYLRQYLKTVHRAVTEGYPVKGYYLWSLLDNFEWSWGNSRRFGITHVDFKNQTRTPKESYRWYQAVIRSNQIL
jgi:beta-glucosidase